MNIYTGPKYNYIKRFAWLPTKTQQGRVWLQNYYQLIDRFMATAAGYAYSYGHVDKDKFLVLVLADEIGEEVHVRDKRNHREGLF